MCNGNCVCGNNDNNDNPKEDIDDLIRVAHDHGYAAGFTDARRVLWGEIMIKAGDMGAMAGRLDQHGSTVDAESMKVAEAAYFNAAETILRTRRDYPGYIEKDEPAEVIWEDRDHCCDEGDRCENHSDDFDNNHEHGED